MSTDAPHEIVAAHDAVVFDCWGTLFTERPFPDGSSAVPLDILADALGVATDRSVVKAYERAFMQAPIDAYEPAIRDLAARVDAADDGVDAAAVAARLDAANERVVAYDDAPDVLDALAASDVALGLLSNTDARSAAALGRTFDLDDWFDATTFSFDAGAIKPDPAVFEAAFDALAVPPSRTVVVGDSPVDDVDAALDAGAGAAILVDRDGGPPARTPRVTRLGALVAPVA